MFPWWRYLWAGWWLFLLWNGAVPPVHAQDQNAVLFISGAASSIHSKNWILLEADLVQMRGYLSQDFYHFNYAGGLDGPDYTYNDTCQSIQTSDLYYLQDIQALQNQGYTHVMVFGHSLGGIIAFDEMGGPLSAPYRTGPNPFVRSIITVDSPINGLNWEQVVTWEGVLHLPDEACPAIHQMGNSYTPQFRAYNDQIARNLQANDVVLHFVVNTGTSPGNGDGAVFEWEQGLDELGQFNINVSVPGHSGPLYDPATVVEIARFTPPQQQG